MTFRVPGRADSSGRQPMCLGFRVASICATAAAPKDLPPPKSMDMIAFYKIKTSGPPTGAPPGPQTGATSIENRDTRPREQLEDFAEAHALPQPPLNGLWRPLESLGNLTVFSTGNPSTALHLPKGITMIA